MCNQNCDYEKCFEFDFIKNDKGIKAPKFSKKNLALINTFLKYNSSYSNAENREEGSYSYILENKMEDFFACLGKQPEKHDTTNLTKKELEKYDEDGQLKDVLYLVVEDIDRINSTHLASEGKKTEEEKKENIKLNKGRVKTANELRQITNLRELLEKGDTELVHKIASFGSDRKYNFSFATKFCAYVSRHALNKDNYCIYDEVVQSILPFYIYHYVDFAKMDDYCNKKKRTNRIESKISDLKTEHGYEKYRNIIDEIIKGIEREDGIKVTYEQFDHMLWYYFKGSKTKVQEALNTIEMN